MSMFSIRIKPAGNMQSFKLINTRTREFVSVLPDLGGRVQELVLKVRGSYLPVISSRIDQNGHQDSIDWYKGAKLSPFPDRVRGGKYSFLGKDYQLPINEPANQNAIHGFLDTKPFSLVTEKVSRGSAVLELIYHYTGDIPGYPFPYQVKIAHQIDKKGYSCSTKVTNTGLTAMPLGDGWHPYLQTGTPASQLALKAPGTQYFPLDSALCPTGELLTNDKFSALNTIGTTQFHICFALSQQKEIVKTLLFDPVKNITLKVWQQTGKNLYNYVQYFIPPDGGSVAIEPLTCPPNGFNLFDKGIDIPILQPGESAEATYGISLL